jgi:hypothetical protein
LYTDYLDNLTGCKAIDDKSAGIATKAFQGLGFLFIGQPKYFLQAQQDGVLARGMFDASFMISSNEFPRPALKQTNSELQQQVLSSCLELLEAEEERVESGRAQMSMIVGADVSCVHVSELSFSNRPMLHHLLQAEKVHGDLDADASVIGGVLQHHLKTILKQVLICKLISQPMVIIFSTSLFTRYRRFALQLFVLLALCYAKDSSIHCNVSRI